MTIKKKNVGTRPRPKQRTPEQQRQHRAEQAARAHIAGRNRDKNAERVIRIGKEMEAISTAMFAPVPDIPPAPTPDEQYVESTEAA